MDMKKTMLAVAAAFLTLVGFADDEDLRLDSLLATNAAPPKTFTSLPLCQRVEGRASVRKPGGEWIDAEEGKFYPFGTSYRAERDGILTISFGTGASVTVADGSEFGTRSQTIGTKSRTIVIVRGTVDVKMPDNLPDGMFFATAPGFTVKNTAGESRIVYADKGDGDSASILCRTGALGVEGRHFDIPVMHAANEVIIRCGKDYLFTSLYGKSGDYVVRVDQGLQAKTEFGEDGQMKSVIAPAKLDWHMYPQTKVIINRALPAIGSRMSVHTMAFDAAGVRKSECFFCEGRSEVNSGELVRNDKVNAEELAKRAAEAAQTTEAAAATTESAPAEEPAAEAESSTSEEEQ